VHGGAIEVARQIDVETPARKMLGCFGLGVDMGLRDVPAAGKNDRFVRRGPLDRI
jgi:hypothetical protein